MQFKSQIRNVFLLALALQLSACAMPGWMPLAGNESGESLSPGQQKTLHFFTNIPNFDTGISLQSGQRYQLDIKLLSNWIDSYIEINNNNRPLDEKGFTNDLMPYEWLGLTRRSRAHNWFELMLVQMNCKGESLRGVSDLDVDTVTGNYSFVAACDGNLTLFVNDSYGFYSNNVGYANIAVSRV